jgi:hypothetical protein
MNVPWVDLFYIPWRNLGPTKNMAAMSGAYFHCMAYSETLKNLLHNGSMDFIIIWYECSLGGPILDSLKKFWSDKKHGRHFHYNAYSETLKNLLYHNGSIDFIIIWYECSFGGPLFVSLRNFDSTKNMATVGQVELSKKFKGLLLFETSSMIQFNVYRNDPWVFLYQNY